MGLNTLTNRSAGQTILDTFFNDIHQAINGDFVGRNSSGVPTSGQSLGTTAIPWGVVRANSLVLNGAAVDTSQITSKQNRIISGKTRTTSNQPAFITPTGSAASFTIFGSATNLVLDVNGTQVTVNTDVAKTGLTVAPGSNNTCLSNDTDAADQADTRRWGEFYHRKGLTVDTMGSEIVSLIGKWASFKLDNGSETEYFFAYVESSTALSKAFRGFFYDSSLAPKNRIVFSNNDTITLLKTGWVFVEDDGVTVDVTYNNPVWSFTSPSSPVTGDYWYDLANNLWKRYDGASFQIIDRTLVGMVVLDGTNCIGARCFDFHGNFKNDHTLNIEVQSTEIVRAASAKAVVSVVGQLIEFEASLPTWNITTDLATAADMYQSTEQASTIYHCYLTDEGDTVMSDIEPYFRPDLLGWYHPHNPWRSVGLAYNNASSNIITASGPNDKCESYWYGGNAIAATDTWVRRFTTESVARGAEIISFESSANGNHWTFQMPMIMHTRSFNYRNAGNLTYGCTINQTALTTEISNQDANVRRTYFTQAAGFGATISCEEEVKIGDRLRWVVGNASGESADTIFAHVLKVRNILK